MSGANHPTPENRSHGGCKARREIERLARELQDSGDIIRGQSADIIRLRAALENARKAILTVDDILAAAGYAVDSSARNLLMCGCPDQALSGEPDSASEMPTTAASKCSEKAKEGQS